MISIKDYSICVSFKECPNLHYEFDFSTFFNRHLAKDAVEYFRAKYEKGTTLSYLAVLSTALSHYDDYLREMNYSGPNYFDDEEKTLYSDYLHSLSGDNGEKYSEKYIHFLIYASKSISQSKQEEGEI